MATKWCAVEDDPLETNETEPELMDLANEFETSDSNTSMVS